MRQPTRLVDQHGLAKGPITPQGETVFQAGGTVMIKPSDKEIAARAYKLWEQNGQPEGRDEEFWRLAEQELLNEDKSSPLRTPDTL
jgi:hypothetical protein